MRKITITLTVLVCLLCSTALAADKQTKGWSGTDVVAYGLNEYGTMVQILYNYIPQRFPQAVVRSFEIGTQVIWTPEMDVWLANSGSNIWIVLYSGGLSNCAVLIGDFGF